METVLLGAADMSALLRAVGRDELMDTVIEALRARFVEHDDEIVHVRARDGFRYDKPAHGLIEWMPTHEIGGPVVVKMVGYHPANPVQRDLPSVIATSSMWDTESGHLIAIADSTLLTAVRTGAASGLATDILGRPGPVTVGIVGLGAQAVTQLHAISRVRTVEHVIGIDTDPAVAESFAERIAFTELDVETRPVAATATIVSEVDVLVTCTSVEIGAEPVVGVAEPRPWLHINAVGADFPGKRELPGELLRDAFVVPDTVEQCLVEGECQQVPADQIGPDIAEVVQRAGEFRGHRDRFTVYDSTGWAVQDDVALRIAVDLAKQHGLGTSIQLERIPDDPFDPYGEVRG